MRSVICACCALHAHVGGNWEHHSLMKCSCTLMTPNSNIVISTTWSQNGTAAIMGHGGNVVTPPSPPVRPSVQLGPQIFLPLCVTRTEDCSWGTDSCSSLGQLVGLRSRWSGQHQRAAWYNFIKVEATHCVDWSVEFLTCFVPEPSDRNSAMARVDVWDAAPIPPPTNLDCGFPRRSIESKYRIGKELGQGGFGSVRVVEDLSNEAQFAVKSIRKSLDIPNVTAAQLERHLDNIRREVQVLRKLRGTVRGRGGGFGQQHARSMHSMQSCMAAWQCRTGHSHATD